jgi:arylsulfatase
MRVFLRHRLRLLLPLWMACATASAAEDRPNVVLILADDVGYSDLGCYGGEIKTPHLDRLADGGVRFTQFYNGARCCPSRASLLTGLYAHQAGMGFMVRPIDHPGYRGDLSRDATTLAELLRGAGYRTGMVGKWHVSRSHSPKDGIGNWPRQRGFDSFYGTLRGYGSFYDPDTLCRDNTFITPENDPHYRPEEYYYTDAISDNAVAFLRDTATQPRPFFLYVAYTAAHWPLQAREQDIAKYRGRYAAGYDAVRQERLIRLRQLGLLPTGGAPAATVGNWDAVVDKEWEARCMETYAAMIDAMDQGVGRILAQLREDGRLENTVVIFLSDNGACAERNGRQPVTEPPPADLRPMRPDELQRRSAPPMQTRDGRWVRSGPGVMAGPPDTWIGYGEAWANVSNTPFREYKHWVHEGGIATPFIVRWPRLMDARPAVRGGRCDEPAHLIDLFPTLQELAQADAVAAPSGRPMQTLEGKSLVPLFSAPDRPLGSSPRDLFWEHESNRAVRSGRWKLVAMENQPWELYDLETDRMESRDLAAAQPERVRDLGARWQAWAERSQVLPLGAWKPAFRTPGK